MDREDRCVAAVAAVALLLCACTVGYSLFYRPQTNWVVLPAAESTVQSAPDRTVSTVETVSAEPAVSSIAESSSPVSSQADALVNINTADLQTLTTLPGIGETLAQRIIDYREKNGDFVSVAELTKVDGIGEKKFAALAAYITV